jgi:hypothetical protein
MQQGIADDETIPSLEGGLLFVQQGSLVETGIILPVQDDVLVPVIKKGPVG